MTEPLLRRGLLAAPLLLPLLPNPALAQRPREAAPAAAPAAPPLAAPGSPWRGVNMAQVESHPFGGPDARLSMRRAAASGADSVAIVPFLWQSGSASPDVSLGSDMSAEQLKAGIEQARELGLRVLVKPHLWVQGGQPGQILLPNAEAWRRWFTSYTAALLQVARVAQEARAEALCIGSGLSRSLARAEWRGVIGPARSAFQGKLIQVVDSTEMADQVQHWDQLDAIGLKLYPALGRDDGPEEWSPVLRREADRIDRLAARWRRRVWVAEVGLRSAAGAAARPWEVVEDRRTQPDPRVQAEVLARWLHVLDRPSVEAVLIWRWFTDPLRGGPQDSDFTVQNKLAEGVMLGAWAR
jgi:hypothetical protein